MKEFDDAIFYDFEDEQRQLQLAKDHLTNFFEGQKFYCGGSIPQSLLYSQDAIDFVRFTEFDAGIKYCYEVITPQMRPPNNLMSWRGMDWDVHTVVSLIRGCQKAGVPLVAQAGIILLHFRFCCGCLRVTRKDYGAWLIQQEILAA